MGLNIELLKKVRERIADIPSSYNQDTWGRKSDMSPCGTEACLAGETVICAAPTVQEGIAELNRLIASDDEFAVPDRAAALLGLKGEFRAQRAAEMGETRLFMGEADGWPEPFCTRYWRARGDDAKAEVAIAYLDHIITTGSLE